MFDSIIQFFAGIPFFQSVFFGIASMVIVGSSWCVVGLVMGNAPKNGVQTDLVQGIGAVFSVIIGFFMLGIFNAWSTSTPPVTFLVCLTLAVVGILNFIMLQIMSHAMQSGPNGIIWAIIQSALVFPFIGGIVFFNVQLTFLRLLGIIALLSALILFALAKDNTSKGGSRWKVEAFIALAITGVLQNLSNAPAYFQEARGVSSIIRALSLVIGTVAAAVCWNLFKAKSDSWQKIKDTLRNKKTWLYIGALQLFGIIFSSILMYPGMNVMADHGMGGMCYPVMVGSCIISFTLTSIFMLKEKIRCNQIFALLVCLAGLILICTD